MCREYHATCTLHKSNTSLGWEDPSFVGSARGLSAWVTHPHPLLMLLTEPVICRLLLTTAPSFTQPPPEPPAPLPRLSSWGLQGCCVSGKGIYHKSPELEASSTMLAIEKLVCFMIHVPLFCKNFLLGQQGPSVLEAILPSAAQHWPLGTIQWQLVRF